MGPVITWDNGPKVSSTELECTARYRDLFISPKGVGYYCIHRNMPKAYNTPKQEYRRAGVPVHPAGTPGGHQVTPKFVAARYFMATINMRIIRYPSDSSIPM